MVPQVVGTFCFWVVLVIFGGYLLPYIFVTWFYKTKNLKKAYNAQWALVTGSSSGIGKAIARKLAGQGLNVVLVALGDDLLDQTHSELKEQYPNVTFKRVGVNLGRPGYLAEIAKQTKGIDVQVVFCNAGYVLTGFFESVALDKHLENLECNATSAVQITHHFLQNLLEKGLKGCFVYTSSAAAAIPSPFSALYASTKSFISSFGASLAPEVKPYGIDVLVFHPSPVASRFYDKAHKLDVLEFFRRMAVSPDDLPDTVFASIGRLVWRDIGATALGFRLLMKVVDYNLMAAATAAFGHVMPDFRRHAKPRHAKAT